MQRYTSYQPHPEAVEALRQPLPEIAPKKRRWWAVWVKRFALMLVLLFIVAVLIGGWFVYRLSAETVPMFGGSPVGNVFSALQSTDITGASANRVNLLIAGNSVDDPGHSGANLTDSIMVLSVNTSDKTAQLISIPRDLWIEIPGYGHAKINAAYEYGQNNNFSEAGLTAGGMGLLEKTVEQNLHIPINYYMLLDYSAVRDMVNAVGGIDVNIQSPDPRGLYDPNIAAADGGPLLLTNGVHHLDGQTALNLTRARGDPTGDGRVAYGFQHNDYDRTQHQRQIFLALEQKAFTTNVLLNPSKLNRLVGALANNLHTDMKINEARRFTQIMLQVKNSNIAVHSLAGDKQTLIIGRTIAGQSVQIPRTGLDDYSEIDSYLQQLGFELNR